MSEGSGEQHDHRALLREAFLSIEKLKARLKRQKEAQHAPIAVIGIGCRLPGAGESLKEFWELLSEGRSGISEVPGDRWDIDAFYDPDPQAPGKMYARAAGFIDRVDRFDPKFFGITPREAASMDPQQRLLLEVAWRAMEHAAIPPQRLHGGNTGVFVGISGTDYSHISSRASVDGPSDIYAGTGNALSIAAGRLSYCFGFQGPSMAVDTSCSSSLVAVHLAMQALRSRQTDAALAGGVNLILSPDPMIVTCKGQMLAPDSRCKTFDRKADGFVRGEGCAMLMLKRLEDAERDGDRVLAVLRGSAINQDGASTGLTAPNGRAQELVLRAALKDAGADPSELGYVEAHGTGTSLGDPIEMRALAEVMAAHHSKEAPLYVGSVKTNLGHLESAAGVAALTKVILAMQHGEVPPHLNFDEPSPHIPWDSIPIEIPTLPTPWPEDRPLAGVSSFGFSGTNAHVILERAPQRPQSDLRPDPPYFLPISARNRDSLAQLNAAWRETLRDTALEEVPAICRVAHAGRDAFRYRQAVIGDDPADLIAALESAELPESPAEPPKIAFLFTGQGAQYLGMGRGLYETEPVFRAAIDRCAELLLPHLDRPLTELMFAEQADGAADALNRTGATQPALFALEYALAELWISWGIEPVAVMGHSVGEYAAACIAGLFSLEDGIRMIAERARLMEALPDGGAMAAVFADEEPVQAALKPYSSTVSIAALNGPGNTVISGRAEDVDRILEGLASDGIKGKRLVVSHAFHSPLMEPMLDSFDRIVEATRYRTPRYRLISNVTGRPVEPGQDGDPSQPGYWRRHVRQPVRFAPGVASLIERGCNLFLEIGPSPTLNGMAARCLTRDTPTFVPSLRKGKDDRRQMRLAAASLFRAGADLDPASLHGPGYPPAEELPGHPFDRQRYWVEGAELPLPGDRRAIAAVAAPEPTDDVFGVGWETAPLVADPDFSLGGRTWLFFADAAGLAEGTAAVLAASGAHTRLVRPGARDEASRQRIDPQADADYRRLLADAPEEPLEIVYAWALDKAAGVDSLELLRRAHKDSVDPLLRLIRAIDSSGRTQPTRIWIVTRGAQQQNSLSQSPLTGLAATLSLEHPERFHALIDLGGDDRHADQAELVAELRAGAPDPWVTRIDDDRRVARLAPAPVADYPPVEIRGDATYLVTGGLGALGLHVADWLVARGAGSVVLAGRNTPSPEIEARLEGMRARGAQIEAIRLDVTSAEEVQDCIEILAAGDESLAGVVHAAGVLDDGVLLQMDAERFERVFAPKVAGAWNLHRATQDLELDFFVLFSSVAGTTGSAGQSNYAAANAFLDALAVQRQAEALPALSVAWGPWAGEGMAGDAIAVDRIDRGGVRRIEPEQGLRILEQALSSELARIVVLPGGVPAPLLAAPGRFAEALLAGIDPGADSTADTGVRARTAVLDPTATGSVAGSQEAPIPEDWSDLSKADREQAVVDYLRGRLSPIIDARPDAIGTDDDLMEIGLDSLMVMELVNRVRDDLGVSLFAREIFDHSTVRRLASHLAGELGPGGVPGRGVAADATGAEDTVAKPGAVLAQRAREFETSSEKNPPVALLISSPRSGSTLLRVMLAGHPALFCPPELHLLSYDRMADRKQELGPSQLDQGLQRAWMELTGKNAEEAGQEISGWEQSNDRVQDVYRRLQEQAGDRLLVDKSPTYGTDPATLQQAERWFREPKYIFLVRHPYSMIESFVRNRMDRLAGADTENPEALAEKVWQETHRNILERIDALGDERCVLVRFEDLVRDPAAESRRLLDFLGLPFDEQVIHPYRGERMTDGVRSQSMGIGDPNFLKHREIDPKLADVWRGIRLEGPLSPETVTMAERLGYELPVESASAATPIPKLERGVGLPLSFTQHRLWFVEQLDPGRAVYNMRAFAFRLRGPLDESALRATLDELVERHESLRTRFLVEDGQPSQWIDDSLEADFRCLDLSDTPEERREREALETVRAEMNRPFDVEAGPLFRAALIRLAEEDHIFAAPMHHLIADGWSMGILAREMQQLYSAFLNNRPSPLTPLSIQFADWAAWQRSQMQGEGLQRQLDYWTGRLPMNPPLLPLPTDRPRPAVQSFAGAREFFELPSELTDGVKEMARGAGATPYMTLMAAFKALLFRYTRQETLLVGTPIANRNVPGVERVFGFCANTLVLRSDLSDELPFEDLIEQVRDTVLGAFDHQEMPFERLVDELQTERDMSHHPLFQVLFTLQSAGLQPPELEGLEATPLSIGQNTSHFDLSLFLWEHKGQFKGVLEYNTDLFEAETIRRFRNHFQALLLDAAERPMSPVGELQIVPDDERRQLEAWNATAVDYRPDAWTLHGNIEAQAARTPDALALQFEDRRTTYAELDAWANRWAHGLAEFGVLPGDRVGVAMERSSEMVVALLAIVKAGAAYVPLDPEYPRERLAGMLEDADVPLVLTQSAVRDSLPPSEARYLAVDSEEAEALNRGASTAPEIQVDPDATAYVIFTSGSTGRPKGAMNAHRGIVNRLLWMQEAFDLDESDRVLQKTPFSFDVSVWEFFWPLMTGAALVVAKPGGHRDPAYMADLIQQERITTIHFVPSMLQAFLAEPKAAGCTALRRVICSGEALPLDLMRRFFGTIDAQLHNLYGPTEAAVDVTWWPCEPTADSVPIGKPIANTTIHILDPLMRPVPIGVAGELFIGGVQVGQGYLNRPELTAEKFVPDPFDPSGNGRLYRTGDLARRRLDGNVEFLGRMDFQVKVRGFRIELGEIESRLAEHPAVGECVVVAREDRPGDMRLVAYHVPDSGSEAASADSLREHLAGTLPEYMVPAHFVALTEMPLSPNGKVDRKALPQPEIDEQESGTYTEPQTELERLIAGIWADVLAIPQVGRDQSFFRLGGHSLLATQVVSRVRDAVGVDLPLRALFETPTVKGLSQRIEARTEPVSDRRAPTRVSRTERLPLSFAQQRLWYLDQLEPGSTAFNLPGGIRLEGTLDVATLERALSELQARHESLRTRFGSEDGEPFQVIDPPTDRELPVIDLTDLPEAEREDEARRLLDDEAVQPFDLERGPLARFRLLRVGADRNVLIVNLHHIVSDGWSMGVLFQDLAELYRGLSEGGESSLQPLRIQYVDYAAWQRDWLQGETLQRQVDWWKGELAGAPPALQLPTDRPRPAVLRPRGARFPVALAPALSDRLKQLCEQEGVTPFMALLAVFGGLLHRTCRQDDVCIGSPIANRNQAGIEKIVGFFVNMLVLRTRNGGNPSLRDSLRRVRESTLGAYDHQDIPFEKLVEELQPKRDMSLHPLFQAMLVFQNAPRSRTELPGLTATAMETDRSAAQVDLSLYLSETDDGLHGGMEYNVELFDEETVARMVGQFERMLDRWMANPDLGVDDVPILSASERSDLLFQRNATDREFPEARLLHQGMERIAAERPEAHAVEFEGRVLTYGELDRSANCVAHHLRSLGVEADHLVGIHMERSLEMVIALMGVLKAGGAYVPLDPAFPADRLEFMLKDSGAQVVLTQESLIETAPRNSAIQVCVDRDWSRIEALPDTAPEVLNRATDRAYVLYTSGSTGLPKGVQISHRAVSNFLEGMRQEPGFGAEDRLLAVTTLSFDISILEIFLPLTAGGTVILVPKETAIDGMSLMSAISSSRATVLQATPATWRLLLEAGWPGDDRLRALCGGEALPRDLADDLVDRCAELWNMYGPTETTIWSSVDRVGREDGPVPVGPPMENTRFYILDSKMQPVPQGVAGELCIGGDGLALGYLNRPKLTAEKFLPDPFRDEPGARIYRTGDLVRYRQDGRIEFLGRIDHQIKIRGFRVELGEIESALAAHPAVREAVVVVREDRPGDARLAAYLIPEGSAPDDAVLREFLRLSLPDYMTPSSFVALDAFPMTPNKKIDRKALPIPGAVEGGTPIVEPRTEAERSVADSWKRILGVERVGVQDNFFDLGGHSLLSMKAVVDIERATGVRLNPGDLIFQTLEQIASSCEERSADAPAPVGADIEDVDPGEAAPGLKKRLLNPFRRVISRVTGGE